MKYAWHTLTCEWCSENIRESDPYKHWPDDVPDDIPVPDVTDEMHYHPDCFNQIISEARDEICSKHRY